ncbi:DUF1574 family protein [Brasilonema sp. UFV-L1]|uniref:DUF1574 family protein n=1 Tax=Brasilonema sp. UFV-L1 TaxID=2234130 RepID=UPI00145F141E|nr:DUF1574 family protein [Brasilonema sp. UFV-L1]NMG08221.1 DUF1574 domain-containing protein [Brasilonema sp. UFV-L1]
MKTELLNRQKSLVQWISQATGISTFGVKIRLQGNNLHILCEGRECPQRWQTLSDLLRALQQTDLDVLTNQGQPSIYQVFVYGRKKGENRAQWCHKVYLNQLEQHLEEVEQALLEDEKKSQKPSGALIASNESLARLGEPEAIARYLSETLSNFGIAVEVKLIKPKPTENNQKNESRLWILCESSYSPDASLIAEPVAQKLRHLKLSGYQDAVIALRVRGENRIDWQFKIDLTPSEVMLKEWARWGDVQALSYLLSEKLSELKVAVKATLKESTLHIFCTQAFDQFGTAPEPDKTLCLEAIRPFLEKIAPQGIVATTVYGQKIKDNQPAWVDWLSLPANEHPALGISAQKLATSFDQPAIVFLLERLLNPDLDTRLKTGGIRVLLDRKADLLHIMCDAPVCPARQQTASAVTQFVRQLEIPGIAGVRVYGRRAGNKEPLWDYSVDYNHRQRLVSEATPEFAAASAYTRELLPSKIDEPVLRPNLPTEEVYTFVTEVTQDWSATLKKFFLETHLFIDNDESHEQTTHHQGLKVALVWGTLGLLLTLQTDWILERFLTRNIPQTSTVTSVLPKSSSSLGTLSTSETDEKRTAFFTTTSKDKSAKPGNSVSNTSESTQADLQASPLKPKATSTAILLAARSHKSGALLTQIPSFNARQLDEQLALYKQRIAKNGHPPDVLIIGSSRALRGIDPVALSKSLATPDSHHIDVFNFGINGATAKVVNFIVRQVLEVSELPKLIIWADGARAFNSGREDITFSTIAASPGYKYILEKAAEKAIYLGTTNTTDQETGIQIGKGAYQAVDNWLNESLAALSASYEKRDNLKNLLKQQLKSLPVMSHTDQAATKQSRNLNLENISQQAVDSDGFLALSTRFQPTTYYQKHSQVSGYYDNDYKSFRLQGDQDIAIQELLRFAKSRKITLVFVNMPLTADYLDSVRSKHEQEFQQYMLNLSTNPNFIYRDLSQFLPKAHDYFSDPSHLNRYGAYKVSQKLANDPMIPWPFK